MAFRGRGRGRGFGFGRGMNFPPAKEEPYVLFPEISLPERWNPKEDDPLITRKLALEKFYKASVYHIKGNDSKSTLDDIEIETYSNKCKPAVQKNKDALYDFIKLSPAYFPAELCEGTRVEHHAKKKLRWDPESDSQMLDRFEKLEGKLEGQSKNDMMAKEEDEDENENAVESGEEADESDEGDYEQNIDFDDDEDDYNMEEFDDEPTYNDS